MLTLAIWAEVTPAAILTKCRMWGDMVRDLSNSRFHGRDIFREIGLLP